MRSILIPIAAVLALSAAPAAAQSWGYGSGYRAEADIWANAAPSAFDWRSQLDRPGDYRCDAYWDASRNDCGERWRDQRHRASNQAVRDYRALAGYSRSRDYYGGSYYGSGYGYGSSYGYGGYGHGYRAPAYGYSSHASYGGYGYGSGGATAYYGAYGRPDLVSGGGGYGGYPTAGGRDPRRVAWCQSAYRSYDPYSGYYRAYSGRLIFCG